jgi:hypothetical protein
VARNGTVREEIICILNRRSSDSKRGGLASRSGSFGSLLGVFRNETDADMRPVYPDQFTPSKCEPGRRQKQEKLSGLQHVDRTLNLKPGTGVGNVEQSAASSPRAIYAHEVYGIAVFNSHTACPSLQSAHQMSPAIAKASWSFVASWTDCSKPKAYRLLARKVKFVEVFLGALELLF